MQCCCVLSAGRERSSVPNVRAYARVRRFLIFAFTSSPVVGKRLMNRILSVKATGWVPSPVKC